MLTFSPLTLFGQSLECCETDKDVEKYISGEWKLKDFNSTLENSEPLAHLLQFNLNLLKM